MTRVSLLSVSASGSRYDGGDSELHAARPGTVARDGAPWATSGAEFRITMPCYLPRENRGRGLHGEMFELQRSALTTTYGSEFV